MVLCGALVAKYNYPNDRRNPAGAIPVYMVAAPAPGPPWPSKQNNGAIPVIFGAAPTKANAGAIPVRVVAGTGPGPKWPSDQGQNAGAIPVYNSVSPKAMPVWDASGPPPLPPPVINSTAFTNSFDNLIVSGGVDVVGTCTATNGPVQWSMGTNSSGLTLLLSAGSGQLVITNGLTVVRDQEYHANIIATNPSGFDVEEITMIWT